MTFNFQAGIFYLLLLCRHFSIDVTGVIYWSSHHTAATKLVDLELLNYTSFFFVRQSKNSEFE